ncbi:MAG: hypothetical protein O7G85_05205 [Planctomycetota bacterium]|nr:hypothetical protein [Planctomycetota bacterium]
MNDSISDSDRIAREAARLYEYGTADSLDQAIQSAAEHLGLTEINLPGVGRVRKHLQGMSMQAMGSEAYADHVREVMGQAEAMMTLLEESYDDVSTMLMGRAARGLIDGGVVLHIRLYTRQSVAELARCLVEHGYAEPTFETASTNLGRLDRIRILDEGYDLVLTRCLPEMSNASHLDLFSGNAIDSVDLEGLRRRIEHLRVP